MNIETLGTIAGTVLTASGVLWKVIRTTIKSDIDKSIDGVKSMMYTELKKQENETEKKIDKVKDKLDESHERLQTTIIDFQKILNEKFEKISESIGEIKGKVTRRRDDFRDRD